MVVPIHRIQIVHSVYILNIKTQKDFPILENFIKSQKYFLLYKLFKNQLKNRKFEKYKNISFHDMSFDTIIFTTLEMSFNKDTVF